MQGRPPLGGQTQGIATHEVALRPLTYPPI